MAITAFEARSMRFWDRAAEKYALRPVADEAAYQEKLRLTQALFHPEMNLLEFGCGTGSTAIVHAPHVHTIHAIDVSEAMLKIARHKTVEAGIDNIQYHRASIDAFACEAESFDMVLGLSILHLLPDRVATLRAVHRHLKAGGYFVSSTVCLGSGFHPLKMVLPFGKWLGLMPDLAFFSADELIAEMESIGFAIQHRWRPDGAHSTFIIAEKIG